MFLARRDLAAARGRFLLMGSVVTLIALLGVLLAGLATGLVDAGTSGLAGLRADHLAFQSGSEATFSRSFLDAATVGALSERARKEGGAATPLGVSLFNARERSGDVVDLALFGVEQGAFLAPEVRRGRGLDGSPPGSVVISAELAREGVKVGDTLTVGLDDRPLTVVGVTEGGTYGHVPLAFTDLATWQDVTPGAVGRDGGRLASAVALRVDDGEAVARGVSGVEVLTMTQAFDGSPGYVAEMSTMTLIRGFLLVISALVVAAFFTVWTVQRRPQIGLLKAMGATNGYVVRDALGQMFVVLLVATGLGTLVGVGLGALMPDAAPFSLEPGAVLGAGAALVVAGLLGSLAAVRRITSVDPLIALGAQR
ncbi:MAG: ABC transporter permease [Microthrixaceae bacterium]